MKLSEEAQLLGLRWFVLLSDIANDMLGVDGGPRVSDDDVPAGQTVLLRHYIPASTLEGRSQRQLAANDAMACPLIRQAFKPSVPATIAEETATVAESAAKDNAEALDLFPELPDADVIGTTLAESAKLSAKSLHRQLFPPVSKNLTSATGKALLDYSMIKEGDRVLIGLSGGKDSMSMLHTLLAMQRRAPIQYEIGCVTMNPNFPGSCMAATFHPYI